MSIHTPHTIIRSWNRYDDDRSRFWPEYHDPFEGIWNLQRPQAPFSARAAIGPSKTALVP